MSSGISRDDWMRALAEAGYQDEHDEQAVTIAEFAAMFGLKRTTAQERLVALVAAGKATSTRKRGINAAGRQVRFRAYRLADQPKAKGKRHAA